MGREGRGGGGTRQNLKKGRKGHTPFPLDRKRGVRVIGKRSVDEKKGCRKGRDRVGGRGRGKRAEDGCKGYEREEDEQGRLDHSCTWIPSHHQSSCRIKAKQRTTIGRGTSYRITLEVFHRLPDYTSSNKGHAGEDH
jgi:hypothetical protein